jgi:hypothetical protein
MGYSRAACISTHSKNSAKILLLNSIHKPPAAFRF